MVEKPPNKLDVAEWVKCHPSWHTDGGKPRGLIDWLILSFGGDDAHLGCSTRGTEIANG